MRGQFLLEMYKTAWSNIARTDELLWKVFISYATVVIGAALLSDKVLGRPFLGVIASLLLTTIAMVLSLNIHLWFLRNLILITNIEAVFLDQSDYGTVIPSKWRPPYQGNFFQQDELAVILSFFYPVFIAFVILAYLPSFDRVQLLVLACMVLALAWWTICYIRRLRRRFNNVKSGAPGGASSIASPPKAS